MKRATTDRGAAIVQHGYMPHGSIRHGTVRERKPLDLDLLGIDRGPSHIVVVTAEGARSHGMLHRHSDQALDALDALLDYHDAANEDADGLLPHQRADYMPPPVKSRPKRRYSYWTRDSIIREIRAWHRKHGRPPSVAEWNVRTKAKWPTSCTVMRHFGSWNAAIEAAGFDTVKPSQNRRDRIAA